MNFTIKGTSLFIESINKLSKKYTSIRSDFYNEFSNLTFEKIFVRKFTMKDAGVAKFKKVRVANSNQNKGKSAGFRVYYFANDNTKEVIFIGIFPKTGPEGKDNMEDKELKKCRIILKREKENNSLVEFTYLDFLQERK